MAGVKLTRGRRGPRRQRGRQTNGNARAVGEFASDAYSLAQRAMKGVQAVARLINIEEKAFDVTGASALATAGTVSYISAIPQGTDYNQRVGDSVKVQSMDIRYQFYANGGLLTYDTVRFIVFRDNENAGSTPAVTDLLTGAAPLNLRNWFTLNRFKILVDEIVDIQAANLTMSTHDVHLPLEKHVKFRGTGATSASAAEGAIFVLAICDNATFPSNLSYRIRLRYTDD